MYTIKLARLGYLRRCIVSASQQLSSNVTVTRQVRSVAGAGSRKPSSALESDHPVKPESSDVTTENHRLINFTTENIPEDLRRAKVRDIEAKYESLLGIKDHARFVDSAYGVIRFDRPPPNPVKVEAEQTAGEHNLQEEETASAFDFGIFDSQLSSTSSTTDRTDNQSTVASIKANKKEQQKSKPKSKPEVNLFDEQFFGTQVAATDQEKTFKTDHGVNETNKAMKSQSPQSHKVTKPRAEVSSRNGIEKNLFDSQYFGNQVQDNPPSSRSKEATAVEIPIKTPNVQVDHTVKSSFKEATAAESPIQSSPDIEKDRTIDSNKSVESSDMNLFDGQYFGTLDEKSTKTTDSQIEHHNTVGGDSEPDMNLQGFVDQMTKQQTETPKENAARSQGTVASSKPEAVQDNFFDEEYFSPALESTHKHTEPQEKKSEKESEKPMFDILADKRTQRREKEKQKQEKWDGEREKRKIKMEASEEDIVIMPQTKHQLKTITEPVANIAHPKTAYDVAMKIRTGDKEKEAGKQAMTEPVKEPRKQKWSGKTDSRGYRNLKDQVMVLDYIPDNEMTQILADSILYEDDKIVAIDKPYGLPSHGGPGIHHSVGKYMNKVGRLLEEPSDQLHLVHRLDKYTTGVMLLAKSLRALDEIHGYFKRQEIGKIYWAITKNVPQPEAGVIDIPMAETPVAGKVRMGLRPDYNEDTKILMKRAKRVKKFTAITEYSVLDSQGTAALVECRTQTGIKHQIRCHLAFGMNCPILGDHKFSHFSKLAPQRLNVDMLQRLGLRQPLVRHLALHLHARSIVLPEYQDGRNVFVSARLPPHFVQNMKWLKLKPPKMDRRVMVEKSGKIVKD